MLSGDQVVYDESGTLVSDAFFEIQGFDSRIVPYAGQDDRWVLILPDPPSERLAAKGEFYLYGEVIGHIGTEQAEYRCSLDRTHVTNHWQGGYEVDVFGGPRVAGFLIGLDGPFAAPRVAEPLEKSELRGFRVQPVKVQSLERAPSDVPILHEIVFLGRNCLRPRKVVGAPNACPFCGRAPLICPECGSWQWKCEQCGNGTLVGTAEHEGAADHRLRAAAIPKAGKILDGRRWDGGDFIQVPGTMLGLVLSKRALDFFASIRAAPLIAQPMRICTDGMSTEQRRQLKDIMQPVAAK